MTINTAGMDRIIRGLDEAIETGIDRSANLIADVARQLSPVDTGELKASISVEDGGAGPLSRKVTAGAGLPDARAVFQEYGTSRMAAQPYMTPAFRAIDVQAEVAAEIRKLTRS